MLHESFNFKLSGRILHDEGSSRPLACAASPYPHLVRYLHGEDIPHVHHDRRCRRGGSSEAHARRGESECVRVIEPGQSLTTPAEAAGMVAVTAGRAGQPQAAIGAAAGARTRTAPGASRGVYYNCFPSTMKPMTSVAYLSLHPIDFYNNTGTFNDMVQPRLCYCFSRALSPSSMSRISRFPHFFPT